MNLFAWGLLFAAGLGVAVVPAWPSSLNPASGRANVGHGMRGSHSSHHPDPLFRHAHGMHGLHSSRHPPSPLCSGITDHDERYYCNALTSGDELFCESITNEGKRQLCRAETSRKER